jgi:hypothetical protein
VQYLPAHDTPVSGIGTCALDLDELVDMAEHELTRTLTDEVCRQCLHKEGCGEG